MADINDITTKFINSQLFGVNDIEEASATVTYIGDESSGTSFGYATEKNNSDYKNYTDAWTNRASLTYQNYKEI